MLSLGSLELTANNGYPVPERSRAYIKLFIVRRRLYQRRILLPRPGNVPYPLLAGGAPIHNSCAILPYGLYLRGGDRLPALLRYAGTGRVPSCTLFRLGCWSAPSKHIPDCMVVHASALTWVMPLF